MLQLQKYNIQLVFKPGREMYLADTLSRAYVEVGETETISEEIEAINMIKDLAITEQQLTEIQQHTESDTKPQTLKDIIQSGWPEMKSDMAVVWFSLCIRKTSTVSLPKPRQKKCRKGSQQTNSTEK